MFIKTKIIYDRVIGMKFEHGCKLPQEIVDGLLPVNETTLKNVWNYGVFELPADIHWGVYETTARAYLILNSLYYEDVNDFIRKNWRAYKTIRQGRMAYDPR